MPRIGSILNKTLLDMERAVIKLELAKGSALKFIEEWNQTVDELDTQIQGYRHAYKLLLEESNKV